MKQTNDRYVPGILLRLERMRQGKGQKEVCANLCVPSYLSKIEHGTASADPQLIMRLFERLSIRCETDENKLKEAEQLAEAYYHALSMYAPEIKEIYRRFRALGEGIAYSVFAIDWLVIEGMQALLDGNSERAEAIAERLSAIEKCMSRRQKGFYCCLKAAGIPFRKADENTREQQERTEKIIACYREACLCLDNAFAYVWLCIAYYKSGNFTAVHEMESRVTTVALDEGNVFYLARYYIIKGGAYASLDLEEMMMACYTRAEQLLKYTVWKDKLNIVYYNIGATLTALRQYDKAMQYLKRVPEAAYENRFELLHKKALIYLRTGRIEQGKSCLKEAKVCLDKNPQAKLSDRLRYEEALWEAEKDFLDRPEYLELMQRLMEALKAEKDFGFRYFYREEMVEACKRQRQYKLALTYQRELSKNF